MILNKLCLKRIRSWKNAVPGKNIEKLSINRCQSFIFDINLPNKKQAKLFEGPVYSDADLGFRGSVKSEEVSDFVATKFDALINFYDEDKLMLNLISVLSVSRFKIGFSSINIKINDFSVATSVNDIAGFTTELKKYLILLNKI